MRQGRPSGRAWRALGLLAGVLLVVSGCGDDDGGDASSKALTACPLRAGAEATMVQRGCRLVASDTAANPDPLPFWGFIACQGPARVRLLESGGDDHPTATGTAQGDDAYRRTTVIDGDDPFGWGERCELGRNDHNVGPTAFYREGRHLITYISLRLPANFDPGVHTWQDVMQMKEAQPYDTAGGGAPILYMGVHDDRWGIESATGEYAHFPARRGTWTRFAFDAHYSQNPQKGRLQVSADLNDDGDFDDPGERTRKITAATLIRETAGPMGSSDGVAAGDSVPSHLRAGIYHDPAIPCPPPDGCSVDVDNVQVVAP